MTTPAIQRELLQFEDQYGDLIDDRVAEAVEEILQEGIDAAVAKRLGRDRARVWLLTVALTAVMSALSVLLADSPSAVVAVWAAGAVICGCQAFVVRTRPRLR
ncbi:hypothetical protein [Streptomyces sp. NBC_01435]|uniref:hypothetical protein n=1 Tax=Streptomyces sp. NBC_01435 TaxID=2903865 RepID=UPI002E2EDC2F|nr:hypothetical protein [Streptomyces sp. NBC_01435]